MYFLHAPIWYMAGSNYNIEIGVQYSFITIQNKSKLDKQLEMSEGQLSITQTELALFCVWSHVLAQTLPKELCSWDMCERTS